jgi:hypothetical protein
VVLCKDWKRSVEKITEAIVKGNDDKLLVRVTISQRFQRLLQTDGAISCFSKLPDLPCENLRRDVGLEKRP